MSSSSQPPVEDASKWVRVKVNDQYYMLNESISDGDESESDNGTKNSKSGKDDRSVISVASSGLTRQEMPGKIRSRSSTISEANTPIKQPVVMVRSSVQSSARSVAAVPVNSEPVSVPVGRALDLVPLRDRNNSTSAAVDRNNTARLRSNSMSKETPEKWRMRIWPSKAIIAFCRIITRCKPPDSALGVRLGASISNKGGRPEKAELKPHWRNSELAKVPTKFEDPSVHSSTFFLLTVEECREAVSHAEDPESFASDADNKFNNKAQQDRAKSNGWINGEITAIVAESAFAPLPKACDPRLGSVWVVAAAISMPAGAGGKHGYTKFGSNCDISGGDLMVLRSPLWSHPLLGIIQPWDPDYDIKYGINFSINQSTYISTQQPGAGRDGAKNGAPPLQVVNILVCVDQSDGLGAEDIGGWASQGSIVPGVGFSMATIGNVMTYIRECQALMSLKLINKSLQNMILTGSFSANYTAALKAATGSSSKTGGGRERSTSMSSDSDGGLSRPNRAAAKVLSPRRALLEQPINCPENVPMPLWLALRRQYNESQLRAICMVSRRFQEKEYHTGQGTSIPVESSLSLLQGPPGTGKTRTILGIVSVFLAGALNLTAQGTTRIVAGASLYGETAGEASTKWSDEKLTRPRGGSISLSSVLSGEGPANGGKKTRVLICAPSNTAVDEVVFRLVTQGVLDSQGKRMSDLSVIRIGQPCRDEYQRTGVDTFCRSGKAGISTNDENMVRTVERATLDNLVEDRRRALMASDTRGQAGATWKVADIRKQILEGADVVCSTLSGAGSQPMLEVVLRITGFKFDAVIIDEAAQAVEPSSLIPFKYNPQAVVLVGDPCQLPATVFSNTAKRAGYSQSLFQRLQVAGYPVLMLETQYRMHPLIAEYPSLRYYQGRLITGSQLITSDSHKMPYHDDPSGKFKPFLFHNVPYSVETNEGTSTSNRDEALYVVDLYEDLVTKYPEHRGGIGIIAPYRAQRRLLNNLFRERFGNNQRRAGGPPPILDLDTEISTVDGFQGREKNIVIFSCVRAPFNRNYYNAHKDSAEAESLPVSDDAEVVVASREDTSEAETRSNSSSSSSNNAGPATRGIGFLKEWQRLNVAITRSRYALWIVGNSDVLSGDSEWKHLVEYSKSKNSFITATLPAHNQQSRPPQHQQSNNNFSKNQPYKNNNYKGNQSNNNNNNGPYKSSKNHKQGGGKPHNKQPLLPAGGAPPPVKQTPPQPPLPPGPPPVNLAQAIANPSQDTNRPAKRPNPLPPGPQVPGPGNSGGKKHRPEPHGSSNTAAPSSSLSSSSSTQQASTDGPFSFDPSTQSTLSTKQGPFSFKVEIPSESRGFDMHERNPAAMHTYLPPSQVAHHPLSPQQRKDQQHLGLSDSK